MAISGVTTRTVLAMARPVARLFADVRRIRFAAARLVFPSWFIGDVGRAVNSPAPARRE